MNRVSAWCIMISLLLWGCTSTREKFSTGLVPAEWSLGEIRSAIVDVLSYYGPVKISSRNRFQSARIPTNDVSNLGREFSMVTAQVDANHPHHIYVSSAVYVLTKKAFSPKGKNGHLEQSVLDAVKRRLEETQEMGRPSIE